MSKMTLEQKKSILLSLCKYGDSIKTDKELANTVIRERLGFIPHKKLYKFRTCSERNFKTLEENCIWMSPASSFPDQFDSTINVDFKQNQKEIEKWLHTNYPVLCFEFVEKLYEQRGLTFPYTYDVFLEYVNTCLDSEGNPIPDCEKQFLREHANSDELAQMDVILQQINMIRDKFAEKEDRVCNDLIEIIDQMRTRTRETMLTYCMTEHFDNHVFWENYAANYSGFCIAYDFSAFDRRPFSDYQNLAFLFPMAYRKRKPYLNMVPFMDGAIRGIISGDSSWQADPKLNADMNLQLYYKDKDYEYEHEWRFSIKNENNCKQFFPFVGAIYAGKDVVPENLTRLAEIAKTLNVPLFKQEINRSKNGFDYIPVEEVK